jgi:DNA-binding NarL/FixJ family response regulator
MAKEVQTQAGRCSTHGTVKATREVPEMGFPFVVYAIWRAVASVARSSAQNAEQPSRHTEPAQSFFRQAPPPLTDRELEVLRLLAAGRSNQRIAARIPGRLLRLGPTLANRPIPPGSTA